MSLEEDIRNGWYRIRGAVISQDGTSQQNLHQATSYDLMPAEMQMSMTAMPALNVGVIYSSTTVNTLAAITAKQTPNGEIALRISPQGAALTMAAPAAGQKTTVAAADTDIIPANSARRYACLVNTSQGGQRITLSFGAAAVLDEGITIYPQGSYEISEAQGNLTLQDIRGWSSAGGGQISWVEGT